MVLFLQNNLLRPPQNNLLKLSNTQSKKRKTIKFTLKFGQLNKNHLF